MLLALVLASLVLALLYCPTAPTTTLSLTYLPPPDPQNACPSPCIILCVDSRSSQASAVASSSVLKVLPISASALGTMAGGAADCLYLIDFLSHHIPQVHKVPGDRLATLLSDACYSRIPADPNSQSGLSVGTMICTFTELPYHLASPTDRFYSAVPKLDPTSQHLLPTIYYVDNTGVRERILVTCVGSGAEIATGVLDRAIVAANARNKLPVQAAMANDPLYRLYRTNAAVVCTHGEAVDMAERAVAAATRRDGYSGGIVQVFQIRVVDGAAKWRRVRVRDVGASS